MKKCAIFLAVIICCLAPEGASAIGVEFAAGLWSQSPSGDLSYEYQGVGDSLDLEDDLDLDSEYRLTGRVKLDMPLLIPNIYLMATPMSFEGTGSKDVNFNFGDATFNANTQFDAEVQLTHYDVALYYGIPLLETASFDKLNIDLGINVRIVDLKAEIEQGGTHESESAFIPVPMAFAAVQFSPIESLSLEAELRGLALGGNAYFSFIGRVKYRFFGPAFAAGGYRFDKLDVDEDGLDVDATFAGPFLEAGFEF